VTTARGFSLVEILVATSLLAVGLVAVATGLQYATGSVDLGRRETIATFFAEQRMESLKSSALADWASPALVAGTISEPYGAILSAPEYRRDTAITDLGGDDCSDPAPVATACKLVRVTVYYRAVTGAGGVGRERRVDVLTVLVARS